jgi:3-methyladenine DNA glycosylase AlkD
LNVRTVAQRNSVVGRARSASDLLSLAQALWDLPEREFQYVAVDLLAKHHPLLDLDNLPRLLELVQRHPWWDTVDGLAGVVGKILLRARAEQPDVQRHMDACLGHSSLWVRRVAMLHQLGWKVQTDEARLLRYALALAPETEFFIRKAIGWALRDYARTWPETVRAFLSEHGQRLSALTRREAGKHLC